MLNEFWNAGAEFGGPNSWSLKWCPDNTKQEPGYFWTEYLTQMPYFTEAWAIMSPTDKYNFTKDLTVGATGPDVVALQKILVRQGFLIIPAGVSYGFFGKLTQDALSKYQYKNGINPAVGYFGPKTRAYINVNQ